MKNTIAERVYDFLKNHPPFSMLDRDKLYTISENVEVLYFEDNTTIFRKGEKLNECFYVVKDGAVGIYSDEKLNMVDKCDEGDIFGLRALLRKDFYQLWAITIEESIVYSIGAELIEGLMENNELAHDFVLTSFATNGQDTQKNEQSDNSTLAENRVHEVQLVQYSKDPVCCNRETSIHEAAVLMTERRVGSVVVTENGMPVGIITDKNFRYKIAAGKWDIHEKVSKIMSSPVVCFHEQITVAEAQIQMMKYGISHICITTDGTPNTLLTGVLSEHDIVVVHGNNPSVLIKEIKRSTDAVQLTYIRKKAQKLLSGYLEQNIPISFVSRIISEINDSITKRIIELSLKEMDTPPPVSFAWLAIGSMGRGEQLLLTDQDNALVFENVSDLIYDKTKAYFVSLASLVAEKLNTVGFEYCPAKMMASNPKWCLAQHEWETQFNHWITTPTSEMILLCTIFFDYNFVYGNPQLVANLTQSIRQSVASFDVFRNYLALNALQNPPPLSFFRNFLVEAGGEHKNQFDIKARAIMPLVDAARLLAISNQLLGTQGTLNRYAKLAEVEPHHKDLFDACAAAFKTLMKFRTIQGLKNNDSGRYVDLDTLSKADKLKLRSSFKPIKEIQEIINIRFMTDHIR